ncbi:MAG: nitronate monooxygenase [Gaiellales bacterium]|jgi:nitronate monooxygenase|nr:nitronate monooxygenase [Gaiellales bacterium]
MSTALGRADVFCRRFGLRLPILLAPMAGVSAPSLSIAVANAGGLGSCGALLLSPAEIKAWVEQVRTASNGAFQLNLWIPEPAPPQRDAAHEARVRDFLGRWGPAVPDEAGDATPPDFGAQCEALLEAAPPIVSSVMGLFPPEFVAAIKARGIVWFANISTVAEARAAAEAGADVVVAQGMEAGGHRGCFDAANAEAQMVGLFSLLPAVVDAVGIPVVATGGIADARGGAAALLLGASAVQIGTGFLRSPEAGLSPAWADELATTAPEETRISQVFSGRAGRSIATDYVRAATAPNAPRPAPYPVQRALTAPLRAAAEKAGDAQRMQVWAGQSAAMSQAKPAAEIVSEVWNGIRTLLA